MISCKKNLKIMYLVNFLSYLQENQVGNIVFASLKSSASISRWWPAIVIEGKGVNKPEKSGFLWIFWFGDHRISQVCIIPFKEKKRTYLVDNVVVF